MTAFAFGREIYIGTTQRAAAGSLTESACTVCGCTVWVGEMAWTGRVLCPMCAGDSPLRQAARFLKGLLA